MVAATRAVLLFCVHFYYDEQLMSLFLGLFGQYADAELKEYLDTGFTQVCTWYCDNKLTLNVKKTKLMLTGS